MENNISYTKTITVSEHHLDQNGHVNNVQYVYWVEEIATEHWENLKFKTPYTQHYWVMIDHHIQYKKEVFVGEQLIVKTYPQKPENIRQPRKVEFYRNGELIVDSRTLWILLENETKKIVRINEDWLDKLSANLLLIKVVSKKQK